MVICDAKEDLSLARIFLFHPATQAIRRVLGHSFEWLENRDSRPKTTLSDRLVQREAQRGTELP